MTTDVLRQHVLRHLDRVKPLGGGQWRASCPVPGHGRGNGDRNPSLTLGPGREQPVVFNCKAGCDQESVKEALIARGADWSTVSRARTEQPSGGTDLWLPCHRDRGAAGHALIESYPYTDADGRLSYTKTRCQAKCFAYWRHDPNSRSGRRWSINQTDPDGTSRRVVPFLPYRLPRVLDAIAQGMCVWVVEGERDANRLAELGIAGTTSGNAGSWTTEHAEYLTGADVVVVADRDSPGMAHAHQVVGSLMSLARSIEVVVAAQGKDARDHLDAGHKTTSSFRSPSRCPPRPRWRAAPTAKASHSDRTRVPAGMGPVRPQAGGRGGQPRRRRPACRARSRRAVRTARARRPPVRLGGTRPDEANRSGDPHRR